MVEISEIVDQDSFKAWLNGLPQESEAEKQAFRRIARKLAFRAAARVVVICWDFAQTEKARDLDLTALPILRCDLISGAATFAPAPEIKTVLNAADAFAAFAASNAADAFTASASAADAAAFAAADASADAAAFAAADAASAVDAFTASAAVAWSALRSDCEKISAAPDDPLGRLWPNDNPLAAVWTDLKTKIPVAKSGYSEETARGPVAEDWSFWVHWYDGLLAGKDLNPDMLTEIALIDPEIWDKGPRVVNPIINGIWENYAERGSTYAERLFINADGLFETEPSDIQAPKAVQIAIDRIRDAIDEMCAIPEGDNLRGACDAEIERLNSYLDRYQAVPLRIYEVLVRTIRKVDAKCDDGVLSAKDERVLDFRTELDNSALDLMQNEPEVKSAIQLRASARFDQMNDIEKSHYRALMELLAGYSTPALAQELREDSQVATDPDADAEDQNEARYRSGSRAIRMRKQAVNLADDAAKIGKGGGAAWDFISTIWTWFT